MSGRRLPRPGSLLRGYRRTLIRDLVFGTFGEISEDSEARKLLRYAVDETADRDLVEDADSTKAPATAAHRVCIFWGLPCFSCCCYNSSYLPQHATNFVPQ